MNGQLSHKSPNLSPSWFLCGLLGTSGQLSKMFFSPENENKMH